MKKLLLSLLVCASFAPAMAGELRGSVDASTSIARVSNGLPNADVQSTRVTLDLPKGHKLGASLADAHAWNERSRSLSVHAHTPVWQNVSLDTEVGFSDKGHILPRQRLTSTLNVAIPRLRLTAGVGADYAQMRDVGTARSFKAHASYRVPNMPVSLQADVMHTQAAANRVLGLDGGWRTGIGATYGTAGVWTASGRLDAGRAHYETVSPPAVVSNFDSTHVGLGTKYWLERNWGLSANFDHVNNRHYVSNELRAGMFFNF